MPQAGELGTIVERGHTVRVRVATALSMPGGAWSLALLPLERFELFPAASTTRPLADFKPERRQ